MFEWIAQTASNVVNAVVDTVENVFGGGDDQGPDVPPPCEGGGCPDAVETARLAHGTQQKACIGARFHMMLLLGAISLATPSIPQAIVFLLLFILAFGLMGLVIAAVAYAILLLFIYAWSPVAEAALRLLAQAEVNLREALVEVNAECSDACLAALPADLVNPEPCNVVDFEVPLERVPLDGLFGFSRRFRGR